MSLLFTAISTTMHRFKRPAWLCNQENYLVFLSLRNISSSKNLIKRDDNQNEKKLETVSLTATYRVPNDGFNELGN
jgi:hypothetical protein